MKFLMHFQRNRYAPVPTGQPLEVEGPDEAAWYWEIGHPEYPEATSYSICAYADDGSPIDVELSEAWPKGERVTELGPAEKALSDKVRGAWRHALAQKVGLPGA